MPHIELAVADFPQETPVRVEHAGKALVIIRTGDEYVAFEDRCPHAFWPLSRGTVRDGILECAGHGWEFSTRTGRCLNAPAHCLQSISVLILENSIRLQWDETRAEPAPQVQPCILRRVPVES